MLCWSDPSAQRCYHPIEGSAVSSRPNSPREWFKCDRKINYFIGSWMDWICCSITVHLVNSLTCQRVEMQTGLCRTDWCAPSMHTRSQTPIHRTHHQFYREHYQQSRQISTNNNALAVTVIDKVTWKPQESSFTQKLSFSLVVRFI